MSPIEPRLRGGRVCQLVAAAAGQGLDLAGENGLLTVLTRQVLQSALEVEMSHHLGYEKNDPAGRNLGNSRSGSTPKTVTTKIGKVAVDVRLRLGGDWPSVGASSGTPR